MQSIGNEVYTFRVPSGIGDISWLYAKLCNFNKEFKFEICGNLPRRSKEFVELLPKVKSCSYGDFTYRESFITAQKGLGFNVDIDKLESGVYYLSANRFLERGLILSEFLPSLSIDYHYEIKTRNQQTFLTNYSPPYIGVYCSKYANYKNDWKFWDAQEWQKFLHRIYKLVNCTFIFFGAHFDTGLGNDVIKGLNLPAINLIGKTHISDVIEIIKKCIYMFAYASGIGVLGDVINIPTMHFLPTPRLDKLVNTYANPINIESGRHLNIPFCSIQEAINVFEKEGLKFIEA